MDAAHCGVQKEYVYACRFFTAFINRKTCRETCDCSRRFLNHFGLCHSKIIWESVLFLKCHLHKFFSKADRFSQLRVLFASKVARMRQET